MRVFHFCLSLRQAHNRLENISIFLLPLFLSTQKAIFSKNIGGSFLPLSPFKLRL
jgi:hypothetical protein